MKLDDILQMWEEDSVVDKQNLSDEALKISKKVVIETSGYTIYVERIEKEANSNIVKIYVKFKGCNPPLLHCLHLFHAA